VLVRLENGRWALGPNSCPDFLLYIEMQEQYDPLDLHQPPSGRLNERDAGAESPARLQARLPSAALAKTGDAYGTYLGAQASASSTGGRRPREDLRPNCSGSV